MPVALPQTCCVAEGEFELRMVLPLPLEGWDYRYVCVTLPSLCGAGDQNLGIACYSLPCGFH